jgi:hypothetical protein
MARDMACYRFAAQWLKSFRFAVMLEITNGRHIWRVQRRMGVEPTRERAERPLSRFEDGETHRSPYTSMSRRIVPCLYSLVKPSLEYVLP